MTYEVKVFEHNGKFEQPGWIGEAQRLQAIT
jgi:hypothetical protein